MDRVAKIQFLRHPVAPSGLRGKVEGGLDVHPTV